jgi:hypothetical protein
LFARKFFQVRQVQERMVLQAEQEEMAVMVQQVADHNVLVT